MAPGPDHDHDPQPPLDPLDLVGQWRTVPGTHTALYDEWIRFDPDGTGALHLDGPALDLAFTWRGAGPGVVACRERVPDGDEPADEVRIRFDQVRVATDTGAVLALRERGTDGFWLLSTPIVRATGRG
ncbi:MAG: hypothetical protein ABMB14_31660 [Myxococcota bacterium]